MIGEALTGDFSDDKRADLTQRTRALAERYPLYHRLAPAVWRGAGLRVSRGPAGTLSAMDEARCPLGVPRRGRDRLRGASSHRRFARRLGVLHYPRERDLHDRPVRASAASPSWSPRSPPR